MIYPGLNQPGEYSTGVSTNDGVLHSYHAMLETAIKLAINHRQYIDHPQYCERDSIVIPRPYSLDSCYQHEQYWTLTRSFLRQVEIIALGLLSYATVEA